MGFLTFTTLMPVENTYEPRLTIKSWAEEDKPREKLLLKGKNALSNAELVAILIGSGNNEETAVELSKRILALAENNLNELGRLSISDFMQLKGIGEAKAISIVAALELGRRRQASDIENRQKITSSRDAYELMAPLLADLEVEQFWVVFLNRANKVIGKKQISAGGIVGTIADPRVIFKEAITSGCVSLILFHNHPSGNLNPSAADVNVTDNMRQAGKILEIGVLDHIIISAEGYYSFADEGKI